MLDKDENGNAKIIDKDIVNLVERLTSGIWTSQKQNLFLSSHDDILIVEDPTDETFISAALKYFKKVGDTLTCHLNSFLVGSIQCESICTKIYAKRWTNSYCLI